MTSTRYEAPKLQPFVGEATLKRAIGFKIVTLYESVYELHSSAARTTSGFALLGKQRKASSSLFALCKHSSCPGVRCSPRMSGRARSGASSA